MMERWRRPCALEIPPFLRCMSVGVKRPKRLKLQQQSRKGSILSMRRSDAAARTLLLAAAAFTAAALSAQTGGPAGPTLSSEAMTQIAFRSLGPSLTTGRISDVALDPKNPSVWYVAAASGNLWKTDNRGNTWTAAFEDQGS